MGERSGWLLVEVAMALLFVSQALGFVATYRPAFLALAVGALIIGIIADFRRRSASRAA